MAKIYAGQAPFLDRVAVAPGTAWQGTFPFALFSFTTAGHAVYRLPTGDVTVGPGEVVAFAPGTWQDWRVVGPGRWQVYYAIVALPAHLRHLLWRDDLAAGMGRVQVRPPERPRIRRIFTEMLAWQQSTSSLRDQAILNQLEYMLLLMRDAHPEHAGDERLRRALDYIHAHLETVVALAEVVAATGISQARLCALFAHQLGISPMSYLERLRLERAAQRLLFSPATIPAIAAQFCFSDRKHFDKRFRRHWRMTPARYRQLGATAASGTPVVPARDHPRL